MTSKQIEKAVKFYRSGSTLKQTARKFRLSYYNMQSLLVSAGVKLRSRSEARLRSRITSRAISHKRRKIQADQNLVTARRWKRHPVLSDTAISSDGLLIRFPLGVGARDAFLKMNREGAAA